MSTFSQLHSWGMLLKARGSGHPVFSPSKGGKTQPPNIFCSKCRSPAVGNDKPQCAILLQVLGAAEPEPTCLETKLSLELLWARAREVPPAPSKLPTWQPLSTCSPNSHPHPTYCPCSPADCPGAIQKCCGLRSHFNFPSGLNVLLQPPKCHL